ncbi:hypothetical protein GQX74_003789 [Glossina fuscipes]|nr:hypothetical protein GQX74_003789 [Glossina fuscipes]
MLCKCVRVPAGFHDELLKLEVTLINCRLDLFYKYHHMTNCKEKATAIVRIIGAIVIVLVVLEIFLIIYGFTANIYYIITYKPNSGNNKDNNNSCRQGLINTAVWCDDYLSSGTEAYTQHIMKKEFV